MSSRLPTRRPLALIVALLTISVLTAVEAGPSRADLAAEQGQLNQSIGAEGERLTELAGRLGEIRGRLRVLDATIHSQDAAVLSTQATLTQARRRLTGLRSELARGRRLLAAQLVAQYEAPAPDLVGVVVTAHGFPDLLNQVAQMRTLARHNSEVVAATARARAAVARQTRILATVRRHQLQIAAATLSERDQVASLSLTLLARQRVTRAQRARHLSQLARVRHRLGVIRARAVAAQRAAFAATVSPTSGGAAIASGEDGFFPAPGTNYSVGEEPEIASRLNALGRALHLHLIGISGYRSPEHSVAVGGFSDDPHTRGEASDTPGVEGVPESTLEQFGLTRPFPGPAEADHIQLS